MRTWNNNIVDEAILLNEENIEGWTKIITKIDWKIRLVKNKNITDSSKSWFHDENMID